MFAALTRNAKIPTHWHSMFHGADCGRQPSAKDKARETVIPVYMGLITQIDDQLGVLFEVMERSEDLMEEHDDCVHIRSW